MRLTPLFALVLPLFACTRRVPSSATTGAVHLSPQQTPTVRDLDPQRALGGENPARELMERAEGISEFAGNTQGLEQLVRALTTAFRANDMPRIEAVIEPILPARSQLLLALTLEGGSTLVPYLTGPAGISQDALEARAREWSTAESFTVRTASGEQIARGANVDAYSPGMRTISGLLRELVKFYRVDFRLPGGRTVVAESWIYAGGKWMFVNEPWRFAQGSPERALANPSTPAGAMLPSGGIR